MRWPRPLLPFLLSARRHCHSDSTSTELSLTETLLSFLHSLPPSSSFLSSNLRQLAPCLTKHIISEALFSCTSPFPAFHLFLFTSSFPHLRSVNSKNRMISLFAQNPDSISQALGLLKELKNDGNGDFELTAAGFAPVIDGLAKSGQFEKAIEVFEKMIPDFDCKPNTTIYNILIKMFVEKEVVLLAMAVYNQMVKSNCLPNRFTYAILLDGLCKTGNLKDALNLFDEMIQRGLSPDSRIYNIILTSFCHSGRINEALKLFDSMREKGREPNKADCNSLLNGLCKTGRVQEAFTRLKTFQKNGFVLGLEGYSSLIQGLFKIGKFDEACLYFKNMINNNIKPDRIIYTIMIKGHANVGRVEDCFSLLNEMTGTGLVPDTFCYNTVIKACCDLGLLDRAKTLKLELSKNDLFPDSATHTILICGLCKAGLINEAHEIFDEMSKLGCQPTVYTFNALVNGLCKAGKIKQANILFYKMEMGKNPSLFLRLTQGTDQVCDGPSLKRMLTQLCQAGEVLKAYKILHGIMDSGVAPDKVTYNVLINGFCKAGDLNWCLKLFKEMQMKGNNPDEFTYCTVINALLRANREEEASRIFNNLLELGFKPIGAIYYSFMSDLCRKNKVSQAISLWFDFLTREFSTDVKAGEEILKIRKNYDSGLFEETMRGLVDLDRVYNGSVGSDPYTIWLVGFCRASRVSDALIIHRVLNENNIDLSPTSVRVLIESLSLTGELTFAVSLVLYSLRKGFVLMNRKVVNLLVKRLCERNRILVARVLFGRLVVAGCNLETYFWQSTKSVVLKSERRFAQLKALV